MVTNTRALLGDEIVEQVSALVEAVFDGLGPLATQAGGLFAGESPPSAADLERLRPLVLDALSGVHGLVVGAGFIAAPHALADQELGFEWWTATGDTQPRQLFISLDPSSDHFLDYTRQSWFTVPRDTGRRHITGPYVDYLCTDEYTLTFTVPVRAGGTFAGVVGSDVYVRELERLLQRRLRGLPGRAALVNTQGRVIVSNTPRQPAGSLVRAFDIPAWWGSGAEPVSEPDTTLRRCGDAPIALLVAR
ncbi:cache domain-containing protein [Prauserella muralis]|uniref:Uncharacterized protein n=1 Tax=Prauserella muralis TaxID=588067 RepID=A0A2V4BEQ9_9PSEU|nr:cache domain-containing protein [Prauserella muralis]PXY32529.1 hypothetical protein BAY60_09770 [Prauserella muralis]TWE23765.1 cache domain-containing protein [Prauserella muralis]